MIRCFLSGHKYETLRKVNAHIEELRCTVCGQEIGYHSPTSSIVILTDEIREAHTFLILLETWEQIRKERIKESLPQN